MNVAEIIDAMGGRPCVARLCGISLPQVSHFFTRNHIPSHHIRFFIALRPELDWENLLHKNTQNHLSVLMDKGVRDVRYARLRRRREIQNIAE